MKVFDVSLGKVEASKKQTKKKPTPVEGITSAGDISHNHTFPTEQVSRYMFPSPSVPLQAQSGLELSGVPVSFRFWFLCNAGRV